MARSRFALHCALLLIALGPTARAQSSSAAAGSAVTLPSGTKIEVAVVRPLWANLAAPGAPLYTQSTFPVVAGDRIAIPPGTYLEGTIEKLTRPTRRSKQAVIEVLFRQIIFANGYVVALPPQPAAGSQAAAPSLIDVTVQATTSNDVLLDNGAPIEVTLAAPLALNAAQVAAAAPLSHAPDPNQFKSASLCRPIAGTPGTPGSPDTVIPGTPGTPDTVIPGGPGMPDTVIPGTPATPSTVIPGSPGTPGSPGRACPAPAMVTASTLVSAPLPAAAH